MGYHRTSQDDPNSEVRSWTLCSSLGHWYAIQVQTPNINELVANGIELDRGAPACLVANPGAYPAWSSLLLQVLFSNPVRVAVYASCCAPLIYL